MQSVKGIAKRAAGVVPQSWKEELKTACGAPSVESILQRMKRNGFSPSTIIDVGAYVGDWTVSVKRIFPSARVLMIEPQPHLHDSLNRTCARLEGVSFKHELLGAEAGKEVGFFQRETASSVLGESEKQEIPSLTLKMNTLDLLT